MRTHAKVLVVLAITTMTLGQRPSFAGSKPIGYPELYDRTTPVDELGNRFGEGDGTTQRLPVEANGDRDLIDRLSKLPLDQQPFWFINWQALEEHRKKPMTYPQRPNNFIDNFPGPFNPVTGTDNNGIPNTNSPNIGSGLGNENRFGNGEVFMKDKNNQITKYPQGHNSIKDQSNVDSDGLIKTGNGIQAQGANLSTAKNGNGIVKSSSVLPQPYVNKFSGKTNPAYP